MAITKGAQKAVRQAKRRQVFNTRRKAAMRDAVKAVQKALVANDAAGATALLSNAYQAIDKAAKRGVIKDNTAARKKSRLVAAIARATAK
jgi:small subunit ribosomal protein S20